MKPFHTPKIICYEFKVSCRIIARIKWLRNDNALVAVIKLYHHDRYSRAKGNIVKTCPQLFYALSGTLRRQGELKDGLSFKQGNDIIHKIAALAAIHRIPPQLAEYPAKRRLK